MTLDKANPAFIDLTEVNWTVSKYSGGGGNCVEVADLRSTEHASVAVRDSKDVHGPALLLGPAAFQAFIRHAAEGKHTA
ncbi:DUF397 domain-containing protein [Streptomyces sp. C]|uniref:DUF397 domain-containing protein n=1 Tax=Streptomyces sp. C TaxID=253839 RepID=UPI0001B4F286|nr:DUF397 domain-containing protein [Streptomyces sp. C]EFL19898.1 predicted protein [Streptomyces sp. C]